MILTKSTVTRILELIRTAYDNAFIGKSERDMINLVELWYDCLNEYPQELVLQATKNAIKSCEFPPRIANIVTEVKKLQRANCKTDVELWAELDGVLYEVYDTARDLRYPCTQASAEAKIKRIYAKLSEEIKLYVVNESTLISIANTSERDKEAFKFEKARFLKTLPELKAHAQDRKQAETFLKLARLEILKLGGDNVN